MFSFFWASILNVIATRPCQYIRRTHKLYYPASSSQKLWTFEHKHTNCVIRTSVRNTNTNCIIRLAPARNYEQVVSVWNTNTNKVTHTLYYPASTGQKLWTFEQVVSVRGKHKHKHKHTNCVIRKSVRNTNTNKVTHKLYYPPNTRQKLWTSCEFSCLK